MDIIIPDINLRNIWQSVWDRLPQEARAELHDVILLVNAEYSTNISGPFLYGAYSPDTIARRGTIFFYYEDLYSLSDVAKAGLNRLFWKYYPREIIIFVYFLPTENRCHKGLVHSSQE